MNLSLLNKTKLKICLIIISFLLYGSSVFSQSSINQLETDINKILDDPFFENSVISIDIFNLSDGITLFQKNNKLLLLPASNMKIVTTLAGLLYLPEYSFSTKMFYTGTVNRDTLFGDVYVLGGFDPDFTTDDFQQFVANLKNLGIKYINGNLIADLSLKDSLYWGNGWMWDDEPDPGTPYLSSLNINDNSIEVFVNGTTPDYLANVKLIPETNYFEIENNTVTISSGKNDIIVTRNQVEKGNKIIVTGKVRKDKIADEELNIQKISVPNPAKYFLTLLTEQLLLDSIYINGSLEFRKLPENALHLSTVFRSIDTVLVNMNKESDNLSAEMILYALALHDSGAPASALNGIEAVKKMIKLTGLDEKNYHISDGSGVSRYNLITTELIVALFKYFYNNHSKIFNDFYNTLPVAGVDGTLENRMLNTLLAGNLRAKTGTLKGVSTLSGFTENADGNLIAFSIFIQNYIVKNSSARSFIDRICNILAGYKHRN